MPDWNAMSDEAFRAEVVRFVAQHCPPAVKHARSRARWPELRPWYMAMSDAGWLAPGWPVEHGGMGLAAAKHLIYLEEMERGGAPQAMPQGVMNLGPVLIAHGSDEQRRRWLPPILAGEHLWCQGFSEPNAGSDLASLRTEAVVDGDEFVVTGQKLWTSGALDANHIYILARTDKAAKPQAGISFLLAAMDQPGITVRPIRTIAGGEEFCEVFLDGVRAHRRDLIGGLNQGWTVAKSLLGFERIWAGSPHHAQHALDELLVVARAFGRLADAGFRDRITALRLDVLDLGATYERVAQVLRTGGSFGFEPSLLKIWAGEALQRVTELTLECAGEHGGLADEVALDGLATDLLTPFLEARAPTIYGGTAQIHRNILAKNVLGLPG